MKAWIVKEIKEGCPQRYDYHRISTIDGHLAIARADYQMNTIQTILSVSPVPSREEMIIQFYEFWNKEIAKDNLGNGSMPSPMESFLYCYDRLFGEEDKPSPNLDTKEGVRRYIYGE